MNKITGKAKGQLDIKRFNVPGIKIHSECPKCGTSQHKDLSSDYFFEPSINKTQKFNFYCEEYMNKEDGGIKATGFDGEDIYLCGKEWSVGAKLQVSVELSNKK